MGVKSGFDYLSGQEEKVITSVNIKGSGVCIKWKIPHEDDEDVKGTIQEIEPAHNDLLDKFKGLKEFCLNCVANKLTGDCRKAWLERCYVFEVTFNSNSKGESAKLKGSLGNGEGQFSLFELPQTPLYDADIEAHETGTTFTFGEHFTELLEGIQQEARMYLGGKRGEMQSNMFNEGEAAEAV